MAGRVIALVKTIISLGVPKALVLAFSLLALGCDNPVMDTRVSNNADGLSYFLPRTLVQVELTPYGYQKGLVVAELTPEEKAAAVESGAIRTRATIDRKQYSVLVDAEGALVDDEVIGVDMSLKEYPTVDGAAEAKKYRQIADARAPLTLVHNENAFFSDRICAVTDGDSLLKTVQSDVKDRTGNFLIAAAKIVGRIKGPDIFASVTSSENGLTVDPVTVEIDPLDRDDWQTVDRAIDFHFPSLKGRYKFSAPEYEALTTADGSFTSCPSGAICYRTMVPQKLILKKGNSVASLAYARVANQRRTNTVEVKRSFLVEQVTVLNFDQGILNTIKVSKNSEALEIAKLPLTLFDTILTAVLSPAGEFLGAVTPGTTAEELRTLLKDNANSVRGLQIQLASLRNEGVDETGPDSFSAACTP